MPMFMDIHEAPGATADAVAAAHLADLDTQAKYGVEYHKYWLNEAQGKIFCLCTAPNADAAMTVHREAHGLVAQKIIEVAPEVAEGFLGGCEVNADGAALLPGTAHSERDSGIRTVLFTDIVDSTSLMERLGDEACIGLFDVHDAVVREALAATNGREIKNTGDGIMAVFASAAGAVRCAIRIQKALAEHSSRQSACPVLVRIGAAAGEPVEANHDLFGSTVNLAARLCAQAEPEQTLVSNVVAELCLGKGLAFRDLGEVPLKGFDQPIRVHAVH
jgi:class 3 adenylate cyclase